MWKNNTTYRYHIPKKYIGFSTSFSALKRINAQVSNLGDRAFLRDKWRHGSSSCVPILHWERTSRNHRMNAASCVDTYCMYIYICFVILLLLKSWVKKQGSFFKWILFKVGLTHDSGNVQRGCDNSRLICIYHHLSAFVAWNQGIGQPIKIKFV